MDTIETRRTTNSTVAWLALIVAIIALLFAVAAFNRTNQHLVADDDNEVTEDTQESEVDVVAARREAADRLTSIRTEVETDKRYDEAADEVAEIRANLRETYADASADAQEEWRDMEPELEALEQQLRDKSADALGGLASLIRALAGEVRTDEGE